MIEQGFKGSKKFKLWLLFLAGIILTAVATYRYQLSEGLTITGMSRDISWGFYVANFTFFVGVAASAVMLVIPYYLHHYEKFGPVIVLGEWLAVAAVIMSGLFIMADMGQPQRFLNILLHPTPGSMLFWDMLVLTGYLLLNLIIAWKTTGIIQSKAPAPQWLRNLTYLSIPWAIAIHTVTAFLYSGLPGRHLWLTAIMAPRFLASAFASGPALLILLFKLQEATNNYKFDPKVYNTLGKIVLYGMIVNIFFYLMEFFTAFYSNIPSHKETLTYLFFGLEGHHKMVPWAWASALLGVSGIAVLGFSIARTMQKGLVFSALLIFFATYIDKGLILVIGGFIPSPMGTITEYSITLPEFIITAGIWAIGLLIISVAFQMTLNLKKESERP